MRFYLVQAAVKLAKFNPNNEEDQREKDTATNLVGSSLSHLDEITDK